MYSHCFPHPWVLDEGSFLLLWPTKGDDSCSLLMLRPCSVGSKVSRKTHLLVLGAGLAGFSQCVILSEKDVGGGVRGWISSCHCWLRASCFLFSNLYINTVHLISFINQKRQPAGCAGSRRGLMMGYVCICQKERCYSG